MTLVPGMGAHSMVTQDSGDSRRAVWVILGASSAVARAFARQAAERGDRIIIAARDTQDLDRQRADLKIRGANSVEAEFFDAAALDQHQAFVDRCMQKGNLNIFLAFGAMPDQAAIDQDPDQVQTVIDVNLTGALSILHRFAPILEQQGRGQVIILSSVAGDRGRIKNYVYGAAKAGLSAYAQGLRARLSRHGVHVLTVKPGFLDTAMTWGQEGMFLVADPADCASACWRAVQKGRNILYYPFFWWIIMAIVKAIPERIFKKLNF